MSRGLLVSAPAGNMSKYSTNPKHSEEKKELGVEVKIVVKQKT